MNVAELIPTTPDPSSTTRSPRVLGLDAARAIAVLAMVFGHTLDATLADSERSLTWVGAYWKMRTFTAPLFLFVSGCALMVVLTRKQLSGSASLRRFGPRVALLFFLGYWVRFP